MEKEKMCWGMPCCQDRGQNGPGGYKVEKFIYRDPEKRDPKKPPEIEDWGLKLLEIPEIRTVIEGTKGKGIKIAVLDTGIAVNHYDFFEKIPENPPERLDEIFPTNPLEFLKAIFKRLLKLIFKKHSDLPDAIHKCKDFTWSLFGAADLYGHGTHVAGIIAARKNGTGVVGVAPEADLYIGKVLGDKGRGTHKALAKGIRWAIKQDVDIISMSLGSNEEYNNKGSNEEYNNKHKHKVDRAIKKAFDKKIILICSAGNKLPKVREDKKDENKKNKELVDGDPNKESLDYPASLDKTISVGAINREHKVPFYSPGKHKVDIVAPGDRITSSYPPQIPYPPQICAVLSGTSMAAAFVSGLAALILAQHRNPNYKNEKPEEYQKWLIDYLTKIAEDFESEVADPKLKERFCLIKPKSGDKKH